MKKGEGNFLYHVTENEYLERLDPMGIGKQDLVYQKIQKWHLRGTDHSRRNIDLQGAENAK